MHNLLVKGFHFFFVKPRLIKMGMILDKSNTATKMISNIFSSFPNQYRYRLIIYNLPNYITIIDDCMHVSKFRMFLYDIKKSTHTSTFS